jgi:hypothetical protein
VNVKRVLSDPVFSRAATSDPDVATLSNGASAAALARHRSW